MQSNRQGRHRCAAWVWVWMWVAAALVACSEAPDTPGTEPAPGVPLRQRDSGYHGDVRAWSTFLGCWGDAVKAQPASSAPRLSILSRNTVLSADPAPSEAELRDGLQALEARLGVALPRSYKDFVLAYRPPPYRPHQGPGGVVLRVGMYAPSQVGRLSDLEPQLVSIFESRFISRDADDATYYHYGIDQDDAALRTSYRAEAIVVGSHGLESHDLIVLHPQERTSDGEMEAAMVMHSGEFRAPSFAELMRQLGHMEATQQQRVPPYAQAALAHGCGAALTPQPAWWE